MNVLSLGWGGEVFNQFGDAVERHVEYARRYDGHHFMVTYSPARLKREPVTFEGRFTVYPSGSRAAVTYVADAVRIASQVCRREKIDLIVSQDPFLTGLAGVLLRRRLGIPLLVQNHSEFIDNPVWISERPLRFRILNALAKKVLPYADAWYVVNERERDVYVQRLGLDPERVFVMHVPCKVRKFAEACEASKLAALRSRFGIPGDVPVLLWVGRPVRFKAIPMLFAAFKRLSSAFPNLWLLLVGPRSLQQEDLGKARRSLGLERQVVWADKGVAHDELAAVYKLGTIYAHTSYYEGLGRVLIEASAAGLPIVATGTAGARRIVGDGETGFLVAVGDPEAFAARVEHLLSNPQLAAQMGRAGQERTLAVFDYDRGMDVVVDLFRKVAAIRPSTG